MTINTAPLNSGPLNSPAGEAFDDWAANLDPLTTQNYYALEIDDGVLSAVRIPISSWQATLQLDRSSFVQAVIPAALEYLQAVNDRTATGEIIIYKGVRYEDGSTQESELARSPITTTRYQRGPNRATITVSGYGATSPPTSTEVRVMRAVRSVTVDSGFRARCAVDWFLRPGHVAVVGDDSFSVAYINYYANADDEYMDIGQRAL